jgi:hypothetical protein
MTGFPYEFVTPNLWTNQGFFQWLEDMGLQEYVDWQVLSLPDRIVGIAFRDKGIASLYKLRWHQP